MTTQTRLSLSEIEAKVCDITAEQLNIPRHKITPSSRLIEDLDCDSLDLVELIMQLEDHFHVTIPERNADIVCKSVFSRKEFRLAELSEVIYIQQGTGNPERTGKRQQTQSSASCMQQFCQLDGTWKPDRNIPIFELISNAPGRQFRRSSDGMRCFQLPAATVEIGTNSPDFDRDARPLHHVEIDSFLIDAEVISTTAYCRFLNSIGEVSSQTLLDWFVLSAEDDRIEHQLIQQTASVWHPIYGCELRPMILVSWYGANAYSLWANGRDWRSYRGGGDPEPPSFLPTEAQWEYAARGTDYREYPWQDEPIDGSRMNSARHVRGNTYTAQTLPLIDVNAQSAVSPFGLLQMAGNVWQWCRDWYSPEFYLSSESTQKNAWNRSRTGIRSERGGSWVGPESLCRSSYRRGRSPVARGRCLGFRCVSNLNEIG